MSIQQCLAVTVLAFSTLSAGRLAAQPPRDIFSRDSARVAWLDHHGRTVRRTNAVVVAPADSVPEVWQQALADSLDRGVAALRRLIGGPFPWQRIASRPSAPITFYLSPERFPGHGSGRGAVFFALPFARAGTASFLREASHELLVPTCASPSPCYPSPWERPDTMSAEAYDHFPNWLFWYGIAGYLAHTAANAEGIHESADFDGGLAGADSVCAARAAGHLRRAEILRTIGAAGELSVLHSTEARTVAPVFLSCTLSMTKYLVERMGLPQVVALFPAVRTGSWEHDIERVAGVPLSEIRRRWLEKLRLSES